MYALLWSNFPTRHHRSIGPGYEEYVEAASFLVFIERGMLATRDELQRELVDDDGNQVRIRGTSFSAKLLLTLSNADPPADGRRLPPRSSRSYRGADAILH